MRPGKCNCLLLAFVAVFCFQELARAASVLWSFTTPDPILASPAIAKDGTVYFGSYDRKIYALTPAGSVKWAINLPPPIYIYFATYTGVYGTPAIGADGTIYVPSENGKLLALNPANGAVLWDYATMMVEGLYSSPAVAPDGTIYFGSFDESLYAINPNGTRKWLTRFDSTIFASPVVGGDGTVYCGCDDGKLYALNPANGSRKWTFDTGPSAITASPAIGTNGTLYIGVGSVNNPKFYSVNTNGTTNWIFTTGSRVRSSAALGPDGTIYFGCDDGNLYALNPNGSQKWAFPAGGAVGSSPAIAADGTIYFGCDDGKLYAVDGNGNQIWTLQTTNYVFASPAIGPDGTVCFASADGVLYALRGCRPAIVSDWPMFRYGIERTGRAEAALTNHPPVLASIADQAIVEGATLTITNAAEDPDVPTQQLRFSLGIGAPAGASINPTNRILQWTPPNGFGSNATVFSVVVTDNGSPPLSDARCLSVVVIPSIPFVRIQAIDFLSDRVTIRWGAVSNRMYRVQYKTNIDDPMWNDAAGDITASGDTATKTDSTITGVPQRFYRVELLP